MCNSYQGIRSRFGKKGERILKGRGFGVWWKILLWYQKCISLVSFCTLSDALGPFCYLCWCSSYKYWAITKSHQILDWMFTLFCMSTVTIWRNAGIKKVLCVLIGLWSASEVLQSWLTVCHQLHFLPFCYHGSCSGLWENSDRLCVKNIVSCDAEDETFVIYQEQPLTSQWVQSYWCLTLG